MTDLTFQGLVNIATGLACWAVNISITVIVIFIIIAGIRYMFAGGDSERVTSAKTNLKWVLIGALVIIGVFAIINSIGANLGVTIPGFPFNCS